MAEVIASGGRHIRSLSLRFPLLHGVMLAYRIQQNCCNLKELHVVRDECYALAHLLQTLPTQLSALRLDYEIGALEMEYIAMHCRRLRKLEFGFDDRNMEKLFSSVGAGLEDLRVRGRVTSQKNSSDRWGSTAEAFAL